MKRYSLLSYALLLIAYNATWTVEKNIPFVPLHKVSIAQLEVFKIIRDNAKEKIAVYADKNRQTYYKLWTEQYENAKHFLNAFNAGFYDGLTSLIGIIVDEDGYCRGYITKAGTASNQQLVYEKFKRGKTRCTAVAPLDKRTDPAYKTFYSQLCTNVEKTGYVFTDLAPPNIVLVDNHYALIDLDSVIPLSEIDDAFIARLFPTDYRKFIQRLKNS